MTKKTCLLFLYILILFVGCRRDNVNGPDSPLKTLTIFFVNDVHGQIDNFSRLADIVSLERQQGDVMLVSSGDIFSGNPEVDFYPQKGYPMIDLMNLTGFDAAVTGNHEFDYGQAVLKERFEQADFPFICANINTSASLLPEMPAWTTVTTGDITVTFLGLIETGGMPGGIVPSTHPARLSGITFTRASDELDNYTSLKDNEGADLLIALSHLGYKYSSTAIYMGDFNLAIDYNLFDVVIGGHSHAIIDTVLNGTPVYQAGGNLRYLGKISLGIRNRHVESSDFELINLNNYQGVDGDVESVIVSYQTRPELDEVIGTNNIYLSGSSNLGLFYTDALRLQMGTDLSFQNTGGIRSSINTGDITVREIYAMDPFCNYALKFNMSVSEIKQFLDYSGSGFYYSGVDIYKNLDGGIVITDLGGTEYSDNEVLTVGINDYIPAVYPGLFPNPVQNGTVTTADVIIEYLRNHTDPLSYPEGSNNYFKY